MFNIKYDYLKKCIDSVLNQKFLDYELIIVNDGSTRIETLQCLNSYKNNKKIKIINKINEGVSEARNYGIKIAKGNYILFLDGDDYFEKDLLYNLYKIVINKDIDILFFKFKTFNSISSVVEQDYDTFELLSYINKDFLYTEIFDPKCAHKFNYGTPWGKLLSRNLLIKNKIFFDKDLPRTQDRVFMLDCCYHAHIIKKYNYSGYIYNYNEESICQKYNVNLWEKLLLVYQKFYNKCIYYKILEKYKNVLDKMLVSFYFESLSLQIFHHDNEQPIYLKIKYASKIYKQYIKSKIKKLNIYDFDGFRKLFVICMKCHMKILVYASFIIKDFFKQYRK